MIETTVKMHPEIEAILNDPDKGEPWLVVAIVDGSIGYSDSRHARILIKHYVEGSRVDLCERYACCYSEDLEKMILDDVNHLKMIEESNPERARRIIEFCKLWEEKVRDTDPLNAAGLAYPTIML